ncbi:MAG: ammonium transporter, partial [Sphingomonadales bacterium]|nr:ammonium transporter [Sphingomonadales bacterium]
MRRLAALAVAAVAMLTPVAALAQGVADDVADTGDTAWILISSALVLMMTMPGLTLFYGGLVRAKNFLAVLVQVGAIAAVASMLWVICGYTMAFGHVTNGWLGAGNAWMLIDLGNVREGLTIPES